MSKLREKYKTEIRGALKEALGLKNILQVPALTKTIVSVGVKAMERESLDDIIANITLITGQVPLKTKARKSIANFKLRSGMTIGAKVTLRGQRMYDFLDRLINASLPRIRDFRGLSPTGFDGSGNYSLGIEDQTIFPEIDPDEVKKVHGLNITIVTSTGSDDDARELLKRFGMPIAETGSEGE